MKQHLVGKTYVLAFSAIATIFAFGVSAQTLYADKLTITTSVKKAKKKKINDANIAAIVTVAGTLDVAYGKIALTKTKNKEIRKFADRMVADHNSIQDAVNELAGKLSLVPVENETSLSLASNGVKVIGKLNSLKGKAFDKFYIDNEVQYHTVVVNAIDKVLIPNATNGELKAALTQALALFKVHLQHAQMVQKSVTTKRKKKKGSGY